MSQRKNNQFPKGREDKIVGGWWVFGGGKIPTLKSILWAAAAAAAALGTRTQKSTMDACWDKAPPGWWWKGCLLCPPPPSLPRSLSLSLSLQPNQFLPTSTRSFQPNTHTRMGERHAASHSFLRAEMERRTGGGGWRALESNGNWISVSGKPQHPKITLSLSLSSFFLSLPFLSVPCYRSLRLLLVICAISCLSFSHSFRCCVFFCFFPLYTFLCVCVCGAGMMKQNGKRQKLLMLMARHTADTHTHTYKGTAKARRQWTRSRRRRRRSVEKKKNFRVDLCVCVWRCLSIWWTQKNWREREKGGITNMKRPLKDASGWIMLRGDSAMQLSDQPIHTHTRYWTFEIGESMHTHTHTSVKRGFMWAARTRV